MKNQYLSKRRALAIKDFFNNKYPPTRNITTKNTLYKDPTKNKPNDAKSLPTGPYFPIPKIAIKINIQLALSIS
jgi:hypothetical protein